MNKEELIVGLKYTEEKHKNDSILTFGTDISAMCSDVLSVLKNCIEIPEGATVGDVMKIMFPKAEVRHGICPVDEKELVLLYLNPSNDMSHITFTPDIWNSPFKITGEE